MAEGKAAGRLRSDVRGGAIGLACPAERTAKGCTDTCRRTRTTGGRTVRSVATALLAVTMCAIAQGCGGSGHSDSDRQRYCGDLGIVPDSMECDRELERVDRAVGCLQSGDRDDCPATISVSTISVSRLEDRIGQQVEQNFGRTVEEVTCSADGEVSAGQSVDCDVTLGDGQFVEIRADVDHADGQWAILIDAR
jgi:hypothetical protein